jgi:hypothetical protein|eukprot:Stramenopile-MAST_4_protein_3243
MARFFLPAIIIAAVFGAARASQYDPHVPKGTPWFEGWYTRISETTTGDSIGLVTGYFPDQKMADPTAYTAAVIDRGMGQPIIVKQTNPSASEVSVEVDGQHGVTKNPDFPSPPNFQYRVGDNDDFVIIQNGNNQFFHASYDGGKVVVDANFSNPSPYGPGGESPEGWAGKLPVLGLHWFVFSLGSSAVYRLEIDGEIITGSGTAHQEKNWGTTFPKAWIWGEAADGSTRIAMAGGPAPIGPITVPNAFLVGYRSDAVDWNFHPQDPALFFPKVDACNGIFEITAKSAMRRLYVKFTVEGTTRTNQANFFDVGGPTRTGFVVDSVESYRAHVQILAFTGFNGDKLVDAKNITMGAIEFGGEYRCK